MKGSGRRRRQARAVDRARRALEWTRRLVELGVLTPEQAAPRINRIRAGGIR